MARIGRQFMRNISRRRLVDKLSNGKLAYVWLPNTTTAGYTSFTRYYHSQQDKEGAIIDERYNHGGMVADYIVNELDRKLMGYFALRDGTPSTSPIAGIYGPKVMLINESAGSGGDALPYYFRLRKVGPLVGTRTWGGLVGTLGVPSTIDGGGITGHAYPSTETTVADWVGLDGCAGTPDTSAAPLDLDSGLPGAETTVSRYRGCQGGATVELWTMKDGQHVPAVGPAFVPAVLDFLLAQSR